MVSPICGRYRPLRLAIAGVTMAGVWPMAAPAASWDLRPITYRGMMETAYEEASLVVVSARDDGWIEVYVDIGPIGRGATDGLLWTHGCLLRLGDTALELRRWEEIPADPTRPPLSFLGEERHALRSSPRDDGAPIAWLEDDDEVVILEFQDDWARIRALIPGVFLTVCIGESWKGRTVQGWIRWRDPEAGTLPWYATRGC